MGGDSRFGSGIHVNSSNVVVTDNLCHDNHYSGIQLVNCSHVLVQANACYDNDNGIGLFSRTGLRDPDGPAGGLVVGVNMLYATHRTSCTGLTGRVRGHSPACACTACTGASSRNANSWRILERCSSGTTNVIRQGRCT